MSRMMVAGVIGAMLLSGEAAAQCSPLPTWTSLTNGTTADASQVMGNFNYQNCTLAPLASPALTGNVTIGAVTAPSPAPFLQFQNQSTTAGVANEIRFWDNSSGTATYGVGISAGSLNIISHGATTFYNNGSAVFSTSYSASTTTPYVGVGTTSPISPLTVQSGNGDLALVGTTGNGLSTDGRVLFYNGTNGTNTFEWQVYSAHSDNSFNVQNNGHTTWMELVSGQNSWSAGSDVRLKTHIKTLSVLDRLDNYRAVSFDWKQTGRHDLGVIAQELYKVFPEIVNKGSEGPVLGPDGAGRWSVQYDKIGALALEAAKELKTENDKLRAANQAQAEKLQALEARMARIETLVKPRITTAAARQ